MSKYDNNPVAAAYVAMYEKKVVERASWVPEEITDEGAAEFMGAAANAAKKGDKTFKFGDKEYKVTMKKDTVDAITKKESVKEEDEVEVCEECGKVHEGACEAGDKKEMDEEYTNSDFLKVSKFVKVKSTGKKGEVVGRYRQDNGDILFTVKLGSKTSKHPGSDLQVYKEVAEPEAKGEKDFKDMHTKNTKKSGEKDDGTVTK